MRKKHDKIVLLTKTKLNSIEVFISRAWIVLKVLKEHDDMKEEIKNLETSAFHQRF